MSRTQLSILTAPIYGGGILDTAPAAVDGTNNNYWVNSGREKVIVTNGSGGSLTVTVHWPAGPRTANTAGTITYTIVSTKVAVLGPFPVDIFNQTDGSVQIDWSSGSSVTASVVSHLPTPGAGF